MTPDEIAAIKARADRLTIIGVLPADHCAVVYRLIGALAERDAEIARLTDENQINHDNAVFLADHNIKNGERAIAAEAALAKAAELVGKALQAHELGERNKVADYLVQAQIFSLARKE